MMALSLVPLEAFGVATDQQKTDLISSVCYGTDATALREQLGKNGLFDGWNDSDEAKYCGLYFETFLGGGLSKGDTKIRDDLKQALSDTAGIIEAHVKWWGNANNQAGVGTVTGRSEDDRISFLGAYCEKKDGKSAGYYNTMATEGYFCVYNDGEMLNPYCVVITTKTSNPDGSTKSTEKKVLCYANEEDAEDTIDIDSNEDIIDNTTSATGDTCGDGEVLGWIFCPIAELVADAIDLAVNGLILPMLQWRVIL